jgi:hypothetical protein
MSTPLHFSNEEKDLLLALAQPIDQRLRTEFLTAVAAELEAAATQTGVGPGPGAVHRVARTVQRRFFDPPQLGESKYRRA